MAYERGCDETRRCVCFGAFGRFAGHKTILTTTTTTKPLTRCDFFGLRLRMILCAGLPHVFRVATACLLHLPVIPSLFSTRHLVVSRLVQKHPWRPVVTKTGHTDAPRKKNKHLKAIYIWIWLNTLLMEHTYISFHRSSILYFLCYCSIYMSPVYRQRPLKEILS